MALDQLVAELKNVEALLDDVSLDPDPRRTDWGRVTAQIDRAKQGAGSLLDRIQAAELLAELEPAEREAALRATAQVAAEVAALVQASGDRAAAGAMLARAR